MDSGERIPPAVSLAFERLASEVCERAALDYDEWPLKAHELATHLQEKWREGVGLNLSTDAAQQRAIEAFGPVKAVAKSLRRPWLLRILTYRRYQTERVVIFLAASFFIAWLTVLDVYYRQELDGKPVDLAEVMLPFSAANFLHGLGGFYIGFIAWGTARLIRWQPPTQRPALAALCQARYLAGALLLFPIFHLAVRPTYLTIVTFRFFARDFLYIGFCGLHMLGVVVGLMGLACLGAELLIDSAKWKHFSQRLAFQLIR